MIVPAKLIVNYNSEIITICFSFKGVSMEFVVVDYRCLASVYTEDAALLGMKFHLMPRLLGCRGPAGGKMHLAH